VAAIKPTWHELPGVLIYSVALTAGVLAALAVQIWFTSAGYDPVAVWQDLFASKKLQLRAAGPWWAMAGAAFIASGATAAALSRLPLPWPDPCRNPGCGQHRWPSRRSRHGIGRRILDPSLGQAPIRQRQMSNTPCPWRRTILFCNKISKIFLIFR
jgi:hypothetical protein